MSKKLDTCGICLEEWKNPLTLPCGHSFCDGCLDEWRSRYGVKEEMRKKCPICRAHIPPSREMVMTLQGYRARKQWMEDNNNDTSSEENYHLACRLLKDAEENIGADWDGVTVLEDHNDKQAIRGTARLHCQDNKKGRHQDSSQMDQCQPNRRPCQCSNER